MPSEDCCRLSILKSFVAGLARHRLLRPYRLVFTKARSQKVK
jgi:hypothetical protein